MIHKVYYTRINEMAKRFLMFQHQNAPRHPFTRSREASNLVKTGIQNVRLTSPSLFGGKKIGYPMTGHALMPTETLTKILMENSTVEFSCLCGGVFVGPVKHSEILYFSRSCQNSSSNFSASTLISCQQLPCRICMKEEQDYMALFFSSLGSKKTKVLGLCVSSCVVPG